MALARVTLFMAVHPAASYSQFPRDTVFDRAALPRVVPFLIYLAFIVLADVLTRLGWDAHQLRWLYAIKVGAVLLALLFYRRQYSELAWTAPSPAVWVQAVLVGLLVFVLWIGLDAGWMTLGTPAGFDPREGGVIDWPLALVRLAGAALVVPIMEELFWRSFLLRWIESADFLRVDPGRVRYKAVLTTVVLFGFEHNLWLAGIVAGVAYTVLFSRNATLWSPICAHSVTNGVLGIWIITTGHWSYW